MDLNALDRAGKSPLQYAEAAGQINTVRCLIRLGVAASNTTAANKLVAPPRPAPHESSSTTTNASSPLPMARQLRTTTLAEMGIDLELLAQATSDIEFNQIVDSLESKFRAWIYWKFLGRPSPKHAARRKRSEEQEPEQEDPKHFHRLEPVDSWMTHEDDEDPYSFLVNDD